MVADIITIPRGHRRTKYVDVIYNIGKKNVLGEQVMFTVFGKSQRTITNYKSRWKLFAAYCASHDIECSLPVSEEQIQDFTSYLRRVGYSTGMAVNCFTAIRFFNRCHSVGIDIREFLGSSYFPESKKPVRNEKIRILSRKDVKSMNLAELVDTVKRCVE